MNTLKTLIVLFSLVFLVNAKDRLSPNECLRRGEQISSANGCFRMVMQTDGNLVIYRNSNGKSTWSTRTAGTCSDRACMQGDGNFVLYCGNRYTWASVTFRNEGASIVLQGDGNLVIYAWNSNRAIWSSGSVTYC